MNLKTILALQDIYDTYEDLLNGPFEKEFVEYLNRTIPDNRSFEWLHYTVSQTITHWNDRLLHAHWRDEILKAFLLLVRAGHREAWLFLLEDRTREDRVNEGRGESELPSRPASACL